MSSEAQISANRRIALLSTGPKTAHGKQMSAMNALVFGLSARRLLLPSENPALYEKFSMELYRQLAPEGPLEILLAERIISTAWRLRRAVNAEKDIFSRLGTYRAGEESHYGGEGWAMLEDGRRGCGAVEKLTRYESNLHNMLLRDLHEFLDLKRLRFQSEGSASTSITETTTLDVEAKVVIEEASPSAPPVNQAEGQSA